MRHRQAKKLAEHEEAMAVLDRLLSLCLEGTRAALQENGSIDHHILLLSGSTKQPEITPFVMTFETEADKAPLIEHLKALVQEYNAWGYLIVYAVWLAESVEKPSQTRSVHPQERREALLVAVITHDCQRGTVAVFERLDGRVVFTEDIDIGSGVELLGRFAALLPGPINRHTL